MDHLLQQALALHRAGDLDKARALYGRVLRAEPERVDALALLGALLCSQDRGEDGRKLMHKARQLATGNGAALLDLGDILYGQGQVDVAMQAWREAAAADPSDARPLARLGQALAALGRIPEAAAALDAALRLDPKRKDALLYMGQLLAKAGDTAKARDLFECALAAHPQSAAAHFNAGVFFDLAGESERAEALYVRTLELQPGHADALINLANRARGLGDHDRASALFQEAADQGSALGHSFLLQHMHYLPSVTQADFLRQAEAFAARHETGLAPVSRPPRGKRERLRVGLLSGDFRRHAVAVFLEPVLARLDKSRFEIFCYDNSPAQDDMTLRMQVHGHAWRRIRDLDDQVAAQVMAADSLDLLVDLAGHTANNRALALARKPAPVQAVWLGYFNTTGLAAMDYILADPCTVPQGAESGFTEKVARLPHCFMCYAPPTFSPEPRPGPETPGTPPTFGCFNEPAKINVEVARLWARILQATPDAKLLLKARVLETEAGRKPLLDLLHAAGIDPARVECAPAGPWPDYLLDYQRVDLALDPFPYNGGATTADALYMGVPVISLRGQTFGGRFGLSILTAAGLGELCAEDADQYVALATGLAADPERLATLRRGLRQRFLASKFCDIDAFTRDLEAAWSAMIGP